LCKRCHACLGYRGLYASFNLEESSCLFLSKIHELRDQYDLRKEFLAQIKAHGLDNQKQDLMYVSADRQRMIKVKVINHQVLGAIGV
jgi:hypothetical protein